MSKGRNEAFKDALHNYLSPVVKYLEDPEVTEVLINGHEEVFIETKGKLHKTPAKFNSEDELLAGITAIANYVDRRITTENPRLDARPGRRRRRLFSPKIRQTAGRLFH